MATPSKNMKAFYKQKKKNPTGGISKSKSSKVTKPAATDIAQLPHGVSLDLKDDDIEEEEKALREFDMNMAYGPCIGITRLGSMGKSTKSGAKSS
ncbi:hypothetical protein E1A91_A13G181600v1 [Gossypium mustelinum]|uniref:DNA polymerase delta subunit 4 n=1 Tax=Gossypium mustelinum TaxID=34275 RepID=A0A5D2WJK0_GOSMU|nr:hypothetical protein E1A91_A13G181600v1 [Gossypium mustelinum]